jgi:hypothetical protein
MRAGRIRLMQQQRQQEEQQRQQQEQQEAGFDTDSSEGGGESGEEEEVRDMQATIIRSDSTSYPEICLCAFYACPYYVCVLRFDNADCVCAYICASYTASVFYLPSH